MLHGRITGEILRGFHQAYAELGIGFLESVCESALAIVLEERGLFVQRQVPIDVSFHSRLIGEFRADLVVEHLVLVELKSCRVILPVHEAQTLNYLRASPLEVGMLLNFGPKPQFRRFVFSNERKQLYVGPRSGPPRSSAANTAEQSSAANTAEPRSAAGS